MGINKSQDTAPRKLFPVVLALVLCALLMGCERVNPRPDISVAEMERIYLANQADFNAVQKEIASVFAAIQDDSSQRQTIRISRSEADGKAAEDAANESLTVTTIFPVSEEERLALLVAARPLLEQTSIQKVFANDRECYYYFYSEWGYEHFVAYREDGRIPGGSFGNIEDSKQIDANWYSVIAHD